VFNKKPNHLFVTVTCRPQKRVPTVFLADGRASFSEPDDRLLEVVFLASLKQKLVFLLLLNLFNLVFFVIVVVPPGNHLIIRYDFCHRYYLFFKLINNT
jgi:hypothetical protein